MTQSKCIVAVYDKDHYLKGTYQFSSRYMAWAFGENWKRLSVGNKYIIEY